MRFGNSDHVFITGSEGASTSNIVSGYTIVGNQSWDLQSQSGLKVSMTENLTGKRVGPRLFFKYLKTKLNVSEKKNLLARLDKLRKIAYAAEESEQHALYETISEKMIQIIQESEAQAVGHGKYLLKADIQKFMNLVKDEDGEGQVFLDALDHFPRLVPTDVQKKIKSLKSKKIFDKFMVLYLTYDPKKLKSNKEKIREKDPILFGMFNGDEERMFFIADWVDEYCDLTLEKFLEKVKEKELPIEVKNVPDMTPEYMEGLKKEVTERRERLKAAKRDTFQGLMVTEDRLKQEKKLNGFQRVMKKIFGL